MTKEKIDCSVSLSQIQSILSKLLRKMPPRGKVTTRQFTLYRRINNSNFRLMLMFCIHGKIKLTKEGTEVSYSIRPILPTLFLSVLFFVFFTFGIINSIVTNRLSIVVLGIAGIVILYFTMLFWQMSKCKSMFRSFLSQEIERVTKDISMT